MFLRVLNFTRFVRLGLFYCQIVQVVDLEGEGCVGRHENLADKEQAIIEATYVTEKIPKVVAGPPVDLGQATEFHLNLKRKQIPPAFVGAVLLVV